VTVLEDLLVYQKALGAAHAVSALLARPAFQCDPELKSQLNRASVRVVSDIAEGFTQKTDRHFAKYLYDSRGSTREIRTQLEIAAGRKYLTNGEKDRLAEVYEEIAKMLTGLIKHLNRADWKQRRR